ncbi:MAG: aminomethyl-transferring glycine dehydrogenase subunit GcvPB [Bauldia sp.]|nr:aminomethyl-transferring glycine dehydrogenase subunit GcvPB [Bauldia sp.]
MLTRPDVPATAMEGPGHRGLNLEEPLLFEVGHVDATGVDLPKPPAVNDRLGKFARKSSLDLAGLSEPETMRHYVRLSRQNYAIDMNTYPLGSCTMKHNPRLNEKIARLPGFGDIHPLQPLNTVPGALEMMEQLGSWLMQLTGMNAISLSPKAGAHGELCGLMAIKAALRARGQAEQRTVVLAPASAHGTNPATAALLGFKVETIPARPDGTVDPADVKAKLGPEVAAIMLTNPNTCGLFERDIVAIAEVVHAAGAYFYCDGANLNAILGRAKPGALGVDAMHINLHKTLSTPHGGGGPGSGPVVLSDALARFAPTPFLKLEDNRPILVEDVSQAGIGEEPFGRLTAFHGQMGMWVRALTYLLSHGVDGVRQASEDAVLNANYVRARLSDLMTQPFGDKPCMHEVLFDDRFLEGTGATTLDIAKALIDEGYHPMTVYFPLVVHGAMLIEPTESESKESLDLFIDAMRRIIGRIKDGGGAALKEAPLHAPRRRLDETRAAREPKLRWKPAAA